MLASSPTWVLALIINAWLSQSLDVNLNFYTSIDCKTVSSITPSAALNLSTCFVTPGLVSLRYDVVACAGGGNAFPYLFKDAVCGTQEDILDYYKTDSDFHCLSDFQDTSTGSIMLSCNQDAPEDPVATSTISIGPVATGATSASTSTSSSSPGSSEHQNNNNNDPTGWDSLSSGAHIGIIVGGAALAFLLLVGSCVGVWWKKRRDPNRSGSQASLNSDSAYLQVLDNVIRAARQHAASGQFDLGVHVNEKTNYGDELPSGVTDLAFQKHDQSWKHKLGAAGELYMFEYLRGLGLPNFGLQNWTSSVRSLVQVYPDYQGVTPAVDRISDIEYYDESGAFTDFLLGRGYGAQNIRPGMRPTYYFEVKATTSPNWQTPFYMSDNQEIHVQNMLIAPNQTQHIYVVCRIFGLGRGSKTRMSVYLDPQALRRSGRLHFKRGVGSEEPWRVQPS